MSVIPLSKVKTKIRKQMQLDKATDALVGLANKLEDELGSGATIQEAANTLNDIEAEDVDFVSEKGKKEVNDRIKKLEKLKESLGDEIKFTDKSKINKAIASLKRGLEEN